MLMYVHIDVDMKKTMTFLHEKYVHTNVHVLFHAYSLNMNHFKSCNGKESYLKSKQ